MKKLAVIDLDKTLLTIDSAFYFLLKYKQWGLLLYGAFRKLRLVPREKFTEVLTRKAEMLLKQNVKEFVKFLNTRVNQVISKEINMLKEKGVEVIIVSGAPDVYVREFGKLYGINAFGSNFKNGYFEYLYGQNKLNFVKENFPDYEYFYTVSDSESDRPLFNSFEESFKLIANKLIRIN